MVELKPCPMCGSPAKIDANYVIECYGWSWQTTTIECTNTAGKIVVWKLHCKQIINI